VSLVQGYLVVLNHWHTKVFLNKKGEWFPNPLRFKISAYTIINADRR